jgi:uncharacterized damage-inducible protein DinB
MPGLVQPTTGEREALVAYLAQQRHVLRLAAYGLSDEQARATPAPSALSVGGLVKHLASVERFWMDLVMQRVKVPGPGSVEKYHALFRLGPGESLVDVLEDYASAAEETEEIVSSFADLAQAIPVDHTVPWFPQDVDAWSLRWVLLHLIEETARHAGHADLIREAVDGATAFPLMAAAECWPATPWIKPWEPGS